MMLRFRRAINHLAVKEIKLVGRKYTWSNNHQIPTLTTIGRVYCTLKWEEWYTVPILQPLPSSTSDHCPLLITPLITPKIKPKLRFESFWTNMQGFHEKVQEAWDREVPHSMNGLATLHVKLSRTTKTLRAWSRSLVPQGKIAMTICREVIGQLEKAQESRQLTTGEWNLIKELKIRILGLAAIERNKAKQKSRITWLQKGDANTRFFQLMVNVRKQRNFIHTLHIEDQLAVKQSEKQQAVYNHF
jgi:hypothetical protein